ncbi:hypothetical protein DSM112329_05125 [Paraconexibacter sp. AEG42_29]|uniref:Uncharacterized protein n=1 Tax=Paraconexibacter sp. AEG42_29 TaxID=2997339 RepID=A0AAU7B3N8_9ACTN
MTPRPITPLALAATLVLTAGLLAACGGDDENSSPTTSTATVATTPAVPRTPTVPRPRGSRLPGATVAPQATGAGTTTTGTGTGGTSTNEDGTIQQRAAGERPFSAQSPWNTRIDTLAVDSRSTQLIRSATARVGVEEGRGSTQLETVQTRRRTINEPLYINTSQWTVPVVDGADNGVPTKITCRQINLPPPNNDCGDGWSVSEISIPADEDPVPENDGWFTVTDRSRGVAYDLWRARRSDDDSSISYQFMRTWDLNGPGFLAPTTVSARGSGMPLFGGLITKSDIESGSVRHALAISVPGPAARNYVQPASVTNGNGPFDSLPEGARIRLKRNISIDRLLSERPGFATGILNNKGQIVRKRRDPFAGNTNRRAARALLLALRRYGAIVVDRAATPTLYAQLNVKWSDPLRRADGTLLKANGRQVVSRDEIRRVGDRAGTPLLRGSEIQGLLLTDFEVVTLPVLRRDPPLDNQLDVATARLGSVSPQVVTTTAAGAAAAGGVATTSTSTTGAGTTSTSTAPRTTSTSTTPRTSTSTTSTSTTSSNAAGVAP